MSRHRSPGSASSTDPKAAREHRYVESINVLRRALGGVSTAHVAADLGLSETDVGRLLRPTGGRFFALADVPALPTSAVRDVCTWLLEPLGLAVVETPDATTVSSDLRLVAAAQKEMADVLAVAIDALADGRMCRAEGAELEHEVDETIARLLALRERARLAQREGVIGMRREGSLS